MRRVVPPPALIRHNERWIVLADISRSTECFYLIKKHTDDKRVADGRELYLDLTVKWNQTIENIFLMAELLMPEWGTLANTMGDGFLIIGAPEHGGTRIKEDLPSVLFSCRSIKMHGENYLRRFKAEFEAEFKKRNFTIEPFPEMKLRMVLDYGHVLRSLGYNRYIGDCINYCSRILSSQHAEETDCIVITDRFGDLFPADVKRIGKGFLSKMKVRGYPSHSNEEERAVWKLPIPDLLHAELPEDLRYHPNVDEVNNDPFWNLVYADSIFGKHKRFATT